jgi:hypothetical protein
MDQASLSSGGKNAIKGVGPEVVGLEGKGVEFVGCLGEETICDAAEMTKGGSG